MKLHFNPNQKHQLDAVDAVVRMFERRPAGRISKWRGRTLSLPIFANQLALE